MATNGTNIEADARLEEPIRHQPPASLDRTPARRRSLDQRALEADYRRSAGGPEQEDDDEEFVLLPLVDKIAYGIARGLIVAVKELEHHIASETRKVGDSVDRRFETLQPTLQDLSKFVAEQRSTNIAVQDHLQQLTVADAGLRETDARQAAEMEELRSEGRASTESLAQRIAVSNASLHEADAQHTTELEALRTETKALSNSVSERIEATAAVLHDADVRQAAELAALQKESRTFSQSVSERIDSICKELDIHQEDIAAIKTTMCTFSSRVDALVERLDRQADAVRSMATAYSQRESELEQVVDGLARLRAYPTPLPTSAL
jgi:chromosome segregation ATPase